MNTQNYLMFAEADTFHNQKVSLLPPTDALRSEMLRCSVFDFINGSNVTLTAVPIGYYDVCLYVWEDTGDIAGDKQREVIRTVFLNGTPLATVASGAAGEWKELGPWRVAVGDGMIRVGTGPAPGDVLNLSGIEVWRVNQQ
jgi:hypothetical protein